MNTATASTGAPTSVVSKSGSSSKKHTGAIAGGVVGGVVVLTIIAGLVFYFVRQRPRPQVPSAAFVIDSGTTAPSMSHLPPPSDDGATATSSTSVSPMKFYVRCFLSFFLSSRFFSFFCALTTCCRTRTILLHTPDTPTCRRPRKTWARTLPLRRTKRVFSPARRRGAQVGTRWPTCRPRKGGTMACLPSNPCPSSTRDAMRMKERGPHFHVLLAETIAFHSFCKLSFFFSLALL